jgi:hypothetical protein
MLLLAALALTVTRASADTGAVLLKTGVKNNNKSKKDAKGLPNAPSTADSSPQRELLVPGQAPNAIFQPSTSMPLTKLIAPIVGGVAGAAALAGVITLSVMKKPKPEPAAPGATSSFAAAGKALGGATPAAVQTTLTRACAIGDTTIEVANTAGFGLGDTIKIGSEYQMIKGFSSIVLDHPMNTAQPAGSIVKMEHDASPAAPATPPPIAAREVVGTTPLVAVADNKPSSLDGISGSSSGDGSSGMDQSTVLAIACVLVVCGLLSVCIVGLLYFCFGKKKKRKTAPRQEPDYYPEDQQPLNGRQMSTRVDMAPDLCESQYMQVNVPPLQPAQSQFVANIGSVPTMQNVVPMQTMPPPPPPAMMSYAQPASGSLFSQQGQSLFAPAAQGQNLFTQGSYYQNASPLANTVNALPTQQFVNMPPTIY